MKSLLCFLTRRCRRGFIHGVSPLVFSQMRTCLLTSYSDYIIISFFRLGAVMCMGVTAGAYILTLFAVCNPSGVVWSVCFRKSSIIGSTEQGFCHSWSIGNAFLVWYLCPLYAKHPPGLNGYIIRFLLYTLPFLLVNMHQFLYHIQWCVFSVGDVKLPLFLWRVWLGEGVLASTLLQ